MTAPKQIYLSPPHMDGGELNLLTEAFESNWITPLGPQVDAFEREVCELVGVEAAVALSSGTAALHLALRLVGVEPGDRVLCSTFTFVASASPIVYLGAEPVFVDAERSSWNMSPALLEEELAASAATGQLPRAVVVTDLFGQCADYDAISRTCDRFQVPLIEDAAEALGGTYRGSPAGSFGRAGVFSFNGNKIITTSGGGMLVSDDVELIEQARFLSTQARDEVPHYQHSKIGYNYRMSNLLAALGRGQLRVLAGRVEARRRIFERYVGELGDLPGLEFMPEADYGRCTRWLTCVSIDPRRFGASREEVRLHLAARAIEARPVWKPMHLQPVFAACSVRGGEVAEQIFDEGLCLPSGSAMTDDDLERVITAIGECCRG